MQPVSNDSCVNVWMKKYFQVNFSSYEQVRLQQAQCCNTGNYCKCTEFLQTDMDIQNLLLGRDDTRQCASTVGDG